MDYARLSLLQIGIELNRIAEEVQAAFGTLEGPQLNWKPDAARWSVGQCFEHLVTANRLTFDAAFAALDPAHPRTIWQRLPILPAWVGPMMVRSQAPENTRRFSAPPAARPAASDVATDVVERFVAQQRQGAGAVARLDERTAERTIMASPFVRLITYSVLDGWRLVVAHDRRHIEQARRVMTSPAFPRGPRDDG
jgi:hypothetical protein